MDLVPVYSDDTGSDDPSKVVLKLSATAEKLAEVRTTPVERKAVLKQVRMVGILDYDETRLTHITAWVPGRIDRMFVDYTGVTVRKGDHMVELYSPELISAQEELIQASKSLKRLSSGSALVRKSTEQALVATREKLILLGLTNGQVKEIEKRGKATDDVTIYAPAGGVVIEKNATEGMYVQTGTRVYSIADLTSLWLHLDAYESDLPWIRYGQDVEFTTQAIPGKVFHGNISFISPVVNKTTRTTRVRVIVDNVSGNLKPGLFVNGVVKARVYGEGKVVDTSLKGKYIGPMHPEIVRDQPGICPICEMDPTCGTSIRASSYGKACCCVCKRPRKIHLRIS
jgi:Cu(I)/Ag(I) efflux system membrane fusion protein